MDNTVLYDLSYGMYAVGVKDGMRECGCIVNTVFQVSTIGPLIALSMNKDNYTCSLIEKNKYFSLSILPETIDSQVITDLGFQTGKDKDKWAKLNHHLFRELPVVDDALGYMMCEVQSQMDAGTHFVFLAKVVDAKKGDSGKPMTYAYYPIFMISTMASACIFSAYFYNCERITWVRVILCRITYDVVVSLFLNTLFTSMLWGTPFLVIASPKLIKNLISLPFQVVILYLVMKTCIQLKPKVNR